MKNITFEKLPSAIEQLLREVEEIKELLQHRDTNNSVEENEKFLTVEETALFLSLSIPTIYSKVSKGELPVMKRSKRLYFSNIELKAYLKSSRRLTNAEVDQAACEFLSQQKLRRQQL